MLKSLVYVSSASVRMSKTELLNILKASKENNRKLDITGMLIYHDGTFIQALEGEADKVDQLYQKIENDTRHRDLTIVSEETILVREFGDWEMGFRLLGDKELSSVSGFANLESVDFSSGDAMQLLKVFYEINISSQTKYQF